jgi:hypothetical protein
MRYCFTKLNILILVFCLAVTLFECKRLPEKSNKPKDASTSGQFQSDSINPIAYNSDTVQTGTQRFELVNGYYFSISGDFDGNGTKETLTEHFYSSKENRETSKWYDSIENYDQLIELIIKKDAYSFVSCDTCAVDTLHVAPGGVSIGLAYLKNEGDLNGDGTDEVSYVVNFTDWSELNTWNIMTYTNGSWKKLYSFPIWDWQLPELPYREYAVAGSQIIPTQLSDMSGAEDDNESFEGLVKKISTGKIQVVFRNENDEVETMLVDLKLCSGQ